MAPEPVARRQVAPGPRSGAGARDRWHRGRPAVRSDRDVERRDRCGARRHAAPDPRRGRRPASRGAASSSSTGWASTPGATTRPGGRFAAAGLVATSFDHRGFGASGGRRAYVDAWDDLPRRRRGPARRRPDRRPPGGDLRALARRPRRRRLPPLRPTPAGRRRAVGAGARRRQRVAAGARRASSTAPGRRSRISNPWDAAKIARDPSRRSWPTPTRSPCPGRPRAWATSSSGPWTASTRGWSRTGGFRLPALVVHGGDDRLVPTASTAFLERFPTIERRVYPGVRHEPHHDPLDGGADRRRDDRVAAGADGRAAHVE